MVLRRVSSAGRVRRTHLSERCLCHMPLAVFGVDVSFISMFFTTLLGEVGAPGCAETVPPRHRIQTDSGGHPRNGSVGAVKAGSCQTEKGVIEWVTRELLLSSQFRAFPSAEGRKAL